jgi:hypothetical protein
MGEMEVDGDARAYAALSQHGRIADLAAIAHALMTSAAESRRPEPQPERVAQLAAERSLTREDATTPLGNAIDVLGRGPADAAERKLARALAGHAVAAVPPRDRGEEVRAANDLLWLAVHTPFDATGLIDEALGPAAPALWEAFAERVRTAGAGAPASAAREEILVAAIALAASSAKAAARQASLLAREVSDHTLVRILAASPRRERHPPEPIRGEMAPAPRGPVTTSVLALTGILLVVQAARIFGRVALAYKRPAQVLPLQDGGIRVQWRVELLGRTLRDRDVLVPRTGLARASRDVRFPGLMLYAGLLALAIGSYVGVGAFVDGVRAASPGLLATGLVVVALGLALDFALSCALPGGRGRCRLLFVPRGGGTLCIGGVDVARADAILAHLAAG